MYATFESLKDDLVPAPRRASWANKLRSWGQSQQVRDGVDSTNGCGLDRRLSFRPVFLALAPNPDGAATPVQAASTAGVYHTSTTPGTASRAPRGFQSRHTTRTTREPEYISNRRADRPRRQREKGC